LFDRWQTVVTSRLEGITIGDHPKDLIEEISEALLQTFAKVPLIDPYAVYQHLMHYWTETMQDDVYMVVTEGWQGAAKIRLVIEDKGNKDKEKPDFQIGKLKYKADFIPPALIVACYFPEDQSVIESLEAGVETVTGPMEEMDEEHGGEEGLLSGAKIFKSDTSESDKGKITKASINAHLKKIRHDKDADDEREILERYLALLEEASDANKKVKEAQKALDLKIAAQYSKLDDETVQRLVVKNKWMTTLAEDVQSELGRLSQTLTTRIKELSERYAKPLPLLEQDVAELSARVEAHLERMGFVWK
jgi:type I restriction enzyme M protein